MDKILIIEDEEEVRSSISDLLSLKGYEVFTAVDGLDAIGKVKQTIPDLVVSDVMMPNMDGFEVLDYFQKNSSTMHIPFIFLTAKVDIKDIRKGMNCGADDYLTKPFKANELLGVISKRLARKKAIDEKMERLKHSIATYVPHELRTPLVSINGFSDLILNDIESLSLDEIYLMVERIKAGSSRLYNTLEKFLTYADVEIIQRDQAIVNELKRKTCGEPDAVIRSAATEAAAEKERAFDLVFNISGNVPVLISQNYLASAVRELVENACKFSVADTPLEITAGVNEQKYMISVKDHGIGMTKEQITAVNAFVQFNREQMQQRGNGLGLAIVKGICSLFEGSFSIESSVNDFTEAFISFEISV